MRSRTMDHIMQHFRKDEQPFIETVADWIQGVENSYAPKLTDFLDPRERYIVQSLVGSTDLVVSAEGYFKESERKRMLIYPDYYEPTIEDYEIIVFAVKYAVKFLTIEHRDVLGSLMSLGLERSKYGDIHLQEDIVQFAVAKGVADYVLANFTTIGKAKIALEPVKNQEDCIFTKETWSEKLLIVSSLRLDTVVASLVGVARPKAAALIKGEKVKVNWTTQTEQALELYEQDMISIRGAGRFSILSIEGRTKKDNIRLLTGQLE